MTFRTIDVVYHAQPQLLARLYLPIGTGPFPAVVDVHGGGWATGDRLNNKVIDGALADAGVAVFAVDFRMPPTHKYPAAVTDIHFAIRWLKDMARALHLDPERIGGLGTSSGAHLLLLATLRRNDARYAALPLDAGGTQDSSLKYLALCWPVADPLARYRMVKEKGNQTLIDAHHSFWADEAAMAEGNPQLLLERGEPVMLPPALIIQGTADNNLPPDSSDRFAAVYRRRGGDVRMEVYEGQPHTFVTREPDAPASRDALAKIVDFAVTQSRGLIDQSQR